MSAMVMLLITLGIVYVGWRVRRDWLWSRRSKRLCTQCHTVRQPARRNSGRLCCPTCGAANPLPLDSPEAQRYTIRRRR